MSRKPLADIATAVEVEAWSDRASVLVTGGSAYLWMSSSKHFRLREGSTETSWGGADVKARVGMGVRGRVEVGARRDDLGGKRLGGWGWWYARRAPAAGFRLGTDVGDVGRVGTQEDERLGLVLVAEHYVLLPRGVWCMSVEGPRVVDSSIARGRVRWCAL